MPPTTAPGPPAVSDIATAMVAALAEIQAKEPAELQSEVDANGGDIEIASPEAVAVIAALEAQYGRDLAQVEDLEPEQLTSLASLGDLVRRNWPASDTDGDA
jgi:hypothetical protein